MLDSLLIRGPFKGPTGYDHHVREFTRQLYKQGVNIQLINLPNWVSAELPERMQDPWFYSLNEPLDAPVILHFCMPHQVVADKNRKNANFTMFEATRIPDLWVDESRSHDLVILPTDSSLRAWRDSGVPEEKIRLCPLGIDPDLFSSTALPLELRNREGDALDQYAVRFLNISELRPRKNLLGLLRAWIKATERKDNAVLIVKLGCYEQGLLEKFLFDLTSVQQNIGKSLNHSAPVCFITEFFPDEYMPRLHRAATHYISMSFGEGWDQPMTEAAVSQLQLIAPRHSAYTTYLDDRVAYLIPSRQAPAASADQQLVDTIFAGLDWWQPDEDAAIDLIRKIIEGQVEPKLSARDRILETYTWEKATRRLIEILAELV